MRLEVYESDREALDALAAAAEAALRESASERPAVALGGGRGGRAIMMALAERSSIPWARLRVTVVDDLCGPAGGALENRRLLRDHLLAPHGLAGGDEAGGPQDAGDPAAYEREVRDVAGPEGAFDLIVVELGPQGEVGVLEPGAGGGEDDAALFVRRPAGKEAGGPDGERIGLGPLAFARARRVLVAALGAERGHALRRALRGPEAAREPAWLIRPSERAVWFVDRAAAGELLRDAQPAPA